MDQHWWKESVVYQVYWRSFYDSNGDGYGDLQGVTKKLDYIKELGADIIWLNPFYLSPDRDNGYDISDYYSVMPKAGSMEDFDELIREAKKRDLRIIMDLVVNHTSNEHEWFKESRSSRDNPKRDWYIWRDGDRENPPNNWRSYFSPSAWEYDEWTKQSYFHSFAVEQPDLNWENKDMRHEIYQIMHFWLKKGISGFRLDAIALLAKPEGFPDAEDPQDIRYLTNYPKVHEYLQEMHEQVFRHYDMLTVGEVAFVSPEQGLLYVDKDRQELNTLFHFEVCDEMPTWDLKKFKEIQARWYEGLRDKGWNSQFLNNHDHTRVVSRYGDDTEYRVQSAKLFAAMLHSLPGMPYIYQGEEIGMTGIRFPSIDEYHDIAMKNKYAEMLSKGGDPSTILCELQPLSRDNSRTPMQWTSGRQAGFTTGTPWIGVNPNYKTINVDNEQHNPGSIFYFYQKVIRLRRQYKVFVYGDYQELFKEHPYLYGYKRSYAAETIYFISNFKANSVEVNLNDEMDLNKASLLISNYNESTIFKLNAYEARIYLVQGEDSSNPVELEKEEDIDFI